MKICIVAEGCYPYVVGGVSGWIHNLIKSFPKAEFIILAIIAGRKQSGKFVYDFPNNLTEVHEVYLEDYDWHLGKNKGKRTRLKKNEYGAFRSLLLGYNVEWDTLFELFQKKNLSVDGLLMGEDFLNAVRECYDIQYSQVIFSDFLWTMRSIYMPLFLILQSELPKADIYHCLSTGYAGILGSMANYRYDCGLIVSEHGIYTREREEELLKAKWVSGIYKNIWISQFKKMSELAYNRADIVSCLYGHAKELQLELGCPEEKIVITPNGIDVSRFNNIPGKTSEDEGNINIGAVLRIAPIKDVKTMLRAFSYAKSMVNNLCLYIMGPDDEEKEYANECYELVEELQIKDVYFTGRVNVTDYIGRMDFTILTSISEGQPLTILESFAAHLAVIATDVGDCRGLIYGSNDDYGTAGILTHIMNVQEIADAMVELGKNPSKRKEMGNNGYRRLMAFYQNKQLLDKYSSIYEEVGWNHHAVWPYE